MLQENNPDATYMQEYTVYAPDISSTCDVRLRRKVCDYQGLSWANGVRRVGAI